jgi:hypothetical protein
MRDFERVLREIRDRLVLEQAPDATPSADGRNRLAAFMRESVSGSFANAILGSSAASVMTPARRSLKSIGLVVGCVLIAGASFAAALQLKAELPSVAANTAELSHGMRLVADYADVSSTWFLIARTAHLNPAASAPTAHLAVQPAVPPSSAPAPQSVRALSGASHHPRAPVAALDLMTSRKTPDFSKSGEAQVTVAASSPAHIESSARPAPSSATIGNGTPHAAPPRTPAPKPAKPKHILPKSGL